MAISDQSGQNFDVIVVGAGLVGSAMACALASDPAGAGLRIAVVEAGGEPARFGGSEFDPRVVALTHASRQLLKRVGAWPRIEEERACPYTHMAVWDGEGTASIEFDCHEVRQPCLGHIVENSVASRALLHCLQTSPGIELLQPVRVMQLTREPLSREWQLRLDDGRQLQAPLVLAADGANSHLRELADIPTREWDYGQSAIVTTVRTERSHGFTAWQRFLGSGPLAFLPLLTQRDGVADNHYSSIVWSIDSELLADVMALDDDAFRQRLAEALEWQLGEVTSVARRFSFPLCQRHAVDYTRPGLALLGDAAHTLHPLAGQGVNLGLLDVAAMSEEILRACRRQIPLQDASILKRYQRARKAHNLAMMALMEGFKRLFGARPPALRWLRNEGLRRFNEVPLLKRAIIRQAMGLSPDR